LNLARTPDSWDAGSPDATKPSRREGFGLVGRLSCLRRGPALPLAARDVRVHGFMLPAVVPLVVHGQLGSATGVGADAPRPVHLVRPWERPDGCSPEPLLCHVRSLPSAGAVDAGIGCGPQHRLRTNEALGSFQILLSGVAELLPLTCSRRSEPESWLTPLEERPHALALIRRPE